MATGNALNGKPYAGNSHVRFDEGEVASAAKPRRGSLLYNVKQKTAIALAAATMMTTALASVDVVYENDFATRTTSDLPPDGEWSEYRYGKGVALAYNFENQPSINRYITPYSWQPSQDGWTKTFGYALLENNMFTTVTDEDDPALVFTDKDVVIGSTQTYAKDHMVAIMHPLRNVFTNGEA